MWRNLFEMNKHQRISTAKYLYDMSKGVALLAIVGNIVQGKWDVPVYIFGFAGMIVFFIFAYLTEGRIKNE